ncbi:alpha/beta fold hydrolase [Nevskia soli]|jgi:pimeloyl-ACP methyl ester carboxylesterase|uniref:alpha/beta fold hydrolase n=1 Tax=Nevskia soli TaxID=418856 RepID=UPI0015D79614|nr:alpha/beta hydrolase [Nevskia soli]
MDRHSFSHNGLTFSYLDAGGEASPVIALHAHWMEGLTFRRLAEALAPGWRVIAPDQRGHGHSDHAETYSREDYLGDLEALFDHVGVKMAVLLGNSLGGVNAYQFAARHPEQVRALIIEDVGVDIAGDLSFCLPWAGTFANRAALKERIGSRLWPYLEDSVRHTSQGWRLAFNPHDMVASEAAMSGDHWADWLASSCPALVIRGSESRVTTAEHLAEMAARRPNTQMRTLRGGHVVHFDDPSGFAAVVQFFLESLHSVGRRR